MDVFFFDADTASHRGLRASTHFLEARQEGTVGSYRRIRLSSAPSVSIQHREALHGSRGGDDLPVRRRRRQLAGAPCLRGSFFSALPLTTTRCWFLGFVGISFGATIPERPGRGRHRYRGHAHRRSSSRGWHHRRHWSGRSELVSSDAGLTFDCDSNPVGGGSRRWWRRRGQPLLVGEFGVKQQPELTAWRSERKGLRDDLPAREPDLWQPSPGVGHLCRADRLHGVSRQSSENRRGFREAPAPEARVYADLR